MTKSVMKNCISTFLWNKSNRVMPNVKRWSSNVLYRLIISTNQGDVRHNLLHRRKKLSQQLNRNASPNVVRMVNVEGSNMFNQTENALGGMDKCRQRRLVLMMRIHVLLSQVMLINAKWFMKLFMDTMQNTKLGCLLTNKFTFASRMLAQNGLMYLYIDQLSMQNCNKKLKLR